MSSQDHSKREQQPNLSDPLEHKKLELEVSKLEEELSRLRLENRRLATLGRNIWPLVSGVLTIAISLAVGLVTWKAQTFSADEEKKKIFFSAVQMATDTKSGKDGRIAGIWTLSDYWHDPNYSGIVANTLAAVLVTDAEGATPQDEAKTQRVREAAAEVIGTAIDKRTPFGEATRLRILLYGDRYTDELGAVTRYQQELTVLKKGAQGGDVASIELKLQATREAIRKNWENLESADFYSHDLSGIVLYEADAKNAGFGSSTLVGANLCGADLSGADFNGADLSYANLSGATLDSTTGWETAILTGVNIHAIKNPPEAFLKRANDPYKETLDSWLSSLHSHNVNLTRGTFTACEKY